MPAFAPGDIENEKQDTAPGNVTEKIVAQPDVPMRAFDQTRNIRDRRAAISVKLDHADDRVQRRERIRRDLRMRRGNFPEQRRFPRIRIADERRVCHRAELEKKMSLLALLAFAVLNWRAGFRALEMHVPLPATTALAEHEFLTVMG